MMRLLIDTNVLLDVFFQREPHVRASAELWQACEDGLCEGYISPLTPVNIFYIAQKQISKAKARELVVETLGVFSVAPLGLAELETALQLDVPDYEDAVQVAAALASGLDAVATRNVNDFAKSGLTVYLPADALKALKS
ncbi:MAG: PIN domain-containing protein [Anaerolineales bacterium]|nr:PIN domain-containing protein [Anaerolineales bacterium]